MSNNLVIKNDSFIQSMHNDIQCIESLDPNDKGTSRQYWFTASMLANIFDISFKTVKNNVDFLIKWGEVTDCKNLQSVQMLVMCLFKISNRQICCGEIQVTQNCATWKIYSYQKFDNC